jgi:glycosyltransferase involved in cell wall biosynthesis
MRQQTTERPLRVLIVSAYALPHIGGVEVIVEQQARTLSELHAEVTVFTSGAGSTIGVHHHLDGYRLVRRRAWNGAERRGVPFPIWGPVAFFSLMRLVRESDVVHVHDVGYQSSLAGGLLARLFRRPLYLTQHVGMVEHDHPAVTWLQTAVYRTYGRLLWRWASQITVYNPIVARFLADHGVPAEKIRLTYNGVDTSYFCPGEPETIAQTKLRYGLAPDKPLVLFVGRLVPKKGVDKLIASRDPAYQIVLAGTGAVPDLPDGVVCVGPLERNELRRLYQACDIFAYPAVGEMLTLAMQEAMGCGLPVVATKEPDYAAYDLNPDGIELVVPEPASLRTAFLEILGDEDRLLRMRRYSRELAVDRFDWRRNAQGLLHLYGDAGPSGAADPTVVASAASELN